MVTEAEKLKKRIRTMIDSYHVEAITESQKDVEEKFNTDCGPFGKCELSAAYQVFVSVLEGIFKDIEKLEDVK